MKTTSLSIQNLSVEVDNKVLLNSVDIQLEKGSFNCLIGPNGAGKSTLMRAIAGLVNFSGTIALYGTDSRKISAEKQAHLMAYVPQSLDHIPAFSVLEFLKIIRYPHGDSNLPQTEKLCYKYLERCGISKLANQSLPTLSGGERQRLLIAAALVQEAPLLLLDEVTTALDPKQEKIIKELLLEVCRENELTVLWATHDINAAITMADNIYGLKNGVLQFCEVPNNALDHMDKLFDRTFIRLQHPEKTSVILV